MMKKMIEKKKMKNKGKKREQKLKSFSALFFCCCCCDILTRRGGSDDARRRRRSCLVKGERNPSLFLVLLLYLLRATKSEKQRIGINIPFSTYISPRLFSSPTEPTTKTRRKRNKRTKERELKEGRRTRTRERQTRFCLCLSRRWDTKEETYRKRWLIVRWLTYYLLLLFGELLLFLWCFVSRVFFGFLATLFESV